MTLTTHTRFRPSGAYLTHGIRQPMRVITCQEANCAAYHNGWTIDLDNLNGDDDVALINRSGKRYRLMGNTLVFEPGQSCFARHRVAKEEDAVFVTGRGDHRSVRLRDTRKWASGLWVEHFEEHLDGIRTKIERL